jgi:hypothetical protein
MENITRGERTVPTEEMNKGQKQTEEPVSEDQTMVEGLNSLA